MKSDCYKSQRSPSFSALRWQHHKHARALDMLTHSPPNFWDPSKISITSGNAHFVLGNLVKQLARNGSLVAKLSQLGSFGEYRKEQQEG